MARSLRAQRWKERLHPRDDHGRFAEKGGARWLTRVSKQFEASFGDTSMAQGTDPRARGRLAGGVIDVGVLSRAAPRSQATSESPWPAWGGMSDAGLRRLTDEQLTEGEGRFPADSGLGEQIRHERTRRAPFRPAAKSAGQEFADTVNTDLANIDPRKDWNLPARQPAPAQAYAGMKRSTLLTLARTAGVPVRGKSNDEIGAALAAKDAERANLGKVKKDAAKVASVDTDAIVSDLNAMKERIRASGDHGVREEDVVATLRKLTAAQLAEVNQKLGYTVKPSGNKENQARYVARNAVGALMDSFAIRRSVMSERRDSIAPVQPPAASTPTPSAPTPSKEILGALAASLAGNAEANRRIVAGGRSPVEVLQNVASSPGLSRQKAIDAVQNLASSRDAEVANAARDALRRLRGDDQLTPAALKRVEGMEARLATLKTRLDAAEFKRKSKGSTLQSEQEASLRRQVSDLQGQMRKVRDEGKA